MKIQYRFKCYTLGDEYELPDPYWTEWRDYEDGYTVETDTSSDGDFQLRLLSHDGAVLETE